MVNQFQLTILGTFLGTALALTWLIIYLLAAYFLILLGLKIFQIRKIPRSKIIIFLFGSGFLVFLLKRIVFWLLELGLGVIELGLGIMLVRFIYRSIDILISIVVIFLFLRYYFRLSGKKLWQFLVYLLILFSVLSSIFYGGILFWRYFEAPKEAIEDEVAEWKTYTETGYWGNKCSIKYSDSWKVEDGYLTPKEKRIPEDIIITINCFPKEKGYISRRGQDLLSFCLEEFNLSQTEKFEAIHSKEFCILDSDGSRVGTATFQIRYGRQRMDFYIPDEEFEPEFNVFKQILPTFKFIE